MIAGGFCPQVPYVAESHREATLMCGGELGEARCNFDATEYNGHSIDEYISFSKGERLVIIPKTRSVGWVMGEAGYGKSARRGWIPFDHWQSPAQAEWRRQQDEKKQAEVEQERKKARDAQAEAMRVGALHTLYKQEVLAEKKSGSYYQNAYYLIRNELTLETEKYEAVKKDLEEEAARASLAEEEFVRCEAVRVELQEEVAKVASAEEECGSLARQLREEQSCREEHQDLLNSLRNAERAEEKAEALADRVLLSRQEDAALACSQLEAGSELREELQRRLAEALRSEEEEAAARLQAQAAYEEWKSQDVLERRHPCAAAAPPESKEELVLDGEAPECPAGAIPLGAGTLVERSLEADVTEGGAEADATADAEAGGAEADATGGGAEADGAASGGAEADGAESGGAEADGAENGGAGDDEPVVNGMPETMAEAWADAKWSVSDLPAYMRDFNSGFKLEEAQVLVRAGEELLAALLAGDQAASSAVLKENPQRAISAIVWALMNKALTQRQGFQEGTFVIHGPGADHILRAFRPYVSGRSSSHFKGRDLCPDDQAGVEEATDPDTEAAPTRCCHFGIDVPPDGPERLPAEKRHVVMGVIQMPDGSRGLYVKPESSGCSTATVASTFSAETIRHGVDYASSLCHRHLGDARSHDEGEFKRKEHLPVDEEERFHQHMERILNLELAQYDRTRIKTFGIGEMVGTLHSQLQRLDEAKEQTQKLLSSWEATYGPHLDLRKGREVMFHASAFLPLADESLPAAGG